MGGEILGKKVLAVMLVLFMTSSLCSGCQKKTKKTKVQLDVKNPVVLQLWNYYSGTQKEIFDRQVEKFNHTVGRKKGIFVKSHSVSGVDELSDAILTAFDNGKGNSSVPDLFAVYPDVAYEVEKTCTLTDLSQYLTEREIAEYIDAYWDAGDIEKDGQVKIFPIAKSTEELFLNKTDWKKFYEETGAEKSKLTTWEGIVELAERYYHWTDAKTPKIKNDGNAFFGMDSFANYMLVGSRQLGKDILKIHEGEIEVQLDKKIMKKLWDCYYVPMVNGWFGAYGRYRSEDIESGKIIAMTGSSSSASFLPDEGTLENGHSYSIEKAVFSVPNFEGTKPMAVQQGSGYAVVKGNVKKEYAAVQFLKWITQKEQNVEFSLESGYLPVKKEAAKKENLEAVMKKKKEKTFIKNVVLTGIETIDSHVLYSEIHFENENVARHIISYSMPDTVENAIKEKNRMIKEGVTREEAIKKLTSEKRFEAWYRSFEGLLIESVTK